MEKQWGFCVVETLPDRPSARIACDSDSYRECETWITDHGLEIPGASYRIEIDAEDAARLIKDAFEDGYACGSNNTVSW